MPVRILIVDDHEIVRQGVRTLLANARPDWEICGEARDGREAIQQAAELRPDAIILDVTMPVMGGLNAAQAILETNHETKVLIFTMQESKTLSTLVQQSGAHGFVLKSQAARDLIVALDKVLSGGTFFRPDVDGSYAHHLGTSGHVY
jgi:DNA-binding NarL/FixJ family response regulator